MSDYLVRALAYDGQVRAYAVNTTEMVKENVRRQKTLPTASAALGRAVTAGTMMGLMLKGNEKLTIKIEGGGPIGAIIVDSNARGETRGYVMNPNVHFELNKWGKLDVARAVGTNGQLSVVKNLGLKEHFTGSVPLVTGELGDDFTYYFAVSEQIPSSVGLGVLVDRDGTILASGGFIIQLMPGASEELIAKLEERIQSVPPVSEMIASGKTPEEMLTLLLGNDNVKIIDRVPVKFHCSCSKERISRALISLGKEEIQDMIEKDGGAETRCHFCNETYTFSKEELQQLL